MEKKFYTSKYDRVFKTIFCDEDNTYLMKTFLSRLLNKEIESLEYLRNELELKNVYDKTKTIDVLVKVDNEYIHIELNIVNNIDYIHLRNYIYFSEVFNKKTRRGKVYDYKTKFIHIDISFGIKSKKEITEYYVMSEDGSKYIDNIKIIEYNMDMIKEICYNENELEKYRHLVMLDSNKEELERISKGDEFVTKFKDKVEELNEKETWVSAMTREEDYELILNTEKNINYEKGIEDNKKEMVNKLYNKNMNLKDISELIDLSEEEVKKYLD